MISEVFWLFLYCRQKLHRNPFVGIDFVLMNMTMHSTSSGQICSRSVVVHSHINCLLYQGCKKAGTARKPGQELMQKKGAMCPPFIHYLTPSAPIETDEVTLRSVLLLGLWMCRECFQGVLICSLLHDISEWRVLAKYQRFIANRNEPESSSVHQELVPCTTVPKGTTCNPLSVD